jgi:elongation factor P
MAILHDGVPYRVLEFEHRTPGNKRGFVQTKLRNMLDGSQREVKFSAGDQVERAQIDAREMEYLYSDGSGAVFMDTENYEQLHLDAEMLAATAPWLSDGMRLHIELLDGNAIGITLPKVVEIGVREAEAVIKGQTAARSSKPAVLENGLTLQVPTFVDSGDRIRVDPAELRYIERVK